MKTELQPIVQNTKVKLYLDTLTYILFISIQIVIRNRHRSCHSSVGTGLLLLEIIVTFTRNIQILSTRVFIASLVLS